ncbi:3-methyl-2-oxobutanoate hydroxymethyltransferase [Desulfonatronovibrio hydrogenovorans]|uniref:3-methyl-2-oxobutanoate hydroxymethyltransferase n=1 Tax=Desulfonatronovibrio hydrogenovorans TaxID=53245 RepID=UPI00048B1E70|nr:3-methyl-2-oxobutanoate hydroxymethyltransferase [Desulfonatronovibrio hydrogenovorans]
MNKTTVPDVLRAKGQNKLAMVTAYDYSMARLADQCGLDMILVGDSLGMVSLGYDSTLPVTMQDMLHHTRAVARGVDKALVVADMPFMSYQTGVGRAVYNAGRFMKESLAGAVKVEGGAAIVPQIRAMVESGIPVMGHLGLTPQHVAMFGGFKVQGRGKSGELIAEQAGQLEQAGCFCLVLEAIPPGLAGRITKKLNIPTIGIGAGPECDGQVLVINDLLGMNDEFTPRFVKKYADLSVIIKKALTDYVQDVRSGGFPREEHCYRED